MTRRGLEPSVASTPILSIILGPFLCGRLFREPGISGTHLLCGFPYIHAALMGRP